MKKTIVFLNLVFLFFFIHTVYADGGIESISSTSQSKKTKKHLRGYYLDSFSHISDAKLQKHEKNGIEEKADNKNTYKNDFDTKIDIIKIELLLSFIFVFLILVLLLFIFSKLKGIKKIQKRILATIQESMCSLENAEK